MRCLAYALLTVENLCAPKGQKFVNVMEAGPGYKIMENGGNSALNNTTISKFAPWNGNWHRWRAKLEAAADLQGVGEAVQAGIAIAANEKAAISDIALLNWRLEQLRNTVRWFLILLSLFVTTMLEC